jgi:hypothetical protein
LIRDDACDAAHAVVSIRYFPPAFGRERSFIR